MNSDKNFLFLKSSRKDLELRRINYTQWTELLIIFTRYYEDYCTHGFAEKQPNYYTQVFEDHCTHGVEVKQAKLFDFESFYFSFSHFIQKLNQKTTKKFQKIKNVLPSENLATTKNNFSFFDFYKIFVTPEIQCQGGWIQLLDDEVMSGIKESTTVFNTAASEFTSLLDKIDEDRNRVLPKVETILDALSEFKLSDLVESLTENLQDKGTDIISSFSKFIDNSRELQVGSVLFLFASVLYDAYSEEDILNKKNCSLLIFALCVNKSNLKMIFNQFMQLYRHIRNFKKSDDTLSTQNTHTPQGDIFGVVALSVYNLMYPDGKPPSKIVWNQMMNYSKARNAFRDIFDSLINMVKYLVSIFGGVSNVPYWLNALNIEDPEVRHLMKEVDEFTRSYFDNTIKVCRSEGDRIFDLKKRLQSYYKRIAVNSYTSNIRDILRMEIMKLDKILEKFRIASYTDDGKRVEPVFLMIAGAPGNFKSQVTERITAALYKEILTPEEYKETLIDPNRWTYFRYEEEKYMDGFTSDAKIIVYDDLSQFTVDPTNADNSYANIMRMYGDWPLRVHKADVDSKGNTYFKCKFILATTNIPVPRIETLKDVNAFYRRIDFAVYQVPKYEFRTADTRHEHVMSIKLDKSNPNFPLGPDGLPSTDPSLLFDYHLYNPKNGEVYEVIQYDELIRRMIELHRRKIAYCEQKNKEIQGILHDTPACSEIELQGETEFIDWTKLVADVKPTCALKVSYYSNDPKFEKMWNNYQVGLQRKDEVSLFIKETSSIFKEAFSRVISDMNIQDDDDYLMLYSMFLVQDYDCMKLFMSLDEQKIRAYIVHNFWVLLTLLEKADLELKVEDAKPVSLMEKLGEFWKNSTDKFKSTWFKACEVFSKNSDKWILLIELIAGIVGIYGSYRAVSYFRNDDTRGSEEEVDESTEEITCAGNIACESDGRGKVFANPLVRAKGKSKVNKSKNLYRNVVVEEPVTEMGVIQDNNGFNIANLIVKDNLFSMERQSPEDPEKYIPFGLITIIRDRIAIMNKHYVSTLQYHVNIVPNFGKSIIRFKKEGSVEGIPLIWYISVEEFIAPTNWYEDDNLAKQDLCLVTVPVGMRRFKDITRFIASREDHAKIIDKNGYLYGYDGKAYTRAMVTCEEGHKIEPSLSSSGVTEIHETYRYLAFTEFGDCGTPLFFFNKFAPVAKWFGIHCAGVKNLGIGYSSKLFREDLIRALTQWKTDTILMADNTLKVQSSYQLSNGQFDRVYDSDLISSTSGKTKIIKSPLYGKWGEALTRPANLRPFLDGKGNTIDPVVLALSKYCTPNVHIPAKILQNIEDAYYTDLCSVSHKECERRLYTFEEAIVGLEMDPDYTALPRKTSPGYPYTFDKDVKKCPGKTYWFGKDETYDLDNPRVEALRLVGSNIEENCKRGIRSEFIFTDCLKDERREHSKVLAGKTRMFSAGPLDYLIIFRRYFGAFSNWFYKNRIDNGSAIGVNPFSKEWDHLARTLLQFGNAKLTNIGAGDYSSYDGSEKPEIHMIILNIINRWYDDSHENQRVRKVLWAEVYNSVHLSMTGHVYTWVSSLPSGHPFTALINTMYNGIAYRYCFYRIFDNSVAKLFMFRDYVYLCALGDDSVFSTHPSIMELYNEVTLTKYMAEIGLTYTPEHKDERSLHRRNISQVSFLKRSFLLNRDDGTYLAPIKIDVVNEIPYWTKENGFLTITKDNADTALLESALHGKEAFHTMLKLLEKYGKEIDYTPRVNNHDAALTFVRESDYFY